MTPVTNFDAYQEKSLLKKEENKKMQPEKTTANAYIKSAIKEMPLQSLVKSKLIKPITIEKPTKPNELIISAEIIKEIESMLPDLAGGIGNKTIMNFGRDVFKLKNYPDLIFKTRSCGHKSDDDPYDKPDNEAVNQRYKNTIKAKKICNEHKLNLIKIPLIKKFKVKNLDAEKKDQWTFIAEKYLPLTTRSEQKKLFNDLANKLDEPIKQLTQFILHSGFNDVNERNVRILLSKNPKRCPKIALFDFEHFENNVEGLIGSTKLGSCGLMQLVADQQKTMIIRMAKEHGICIEAKEKKEEGVKSAIQVNIDELDLNRDKDEAFVKDGKATTPRKEAQRIIDQINLSLTKNSQEKIHLKLRGLLDYTILVELYKRKHIHTYKILDDVDDAAEIQVFEK